MRIYKHAKGAIMGEEDLKPVDTVNINAVN